MYGIFLLGLSGVYWCFFFLRNDLTVLAFGAYIILVPNGFFLSFFLFSLLGGEQKKMLRTGGEKGRSVVGEGQVAVEVVQKNTFLSLLLSRWVSPSPRFIVISFHFPFTFFSLCWDFLCLVFSLSPIAWDSVFSGQAVYGRRTRGY